MQELARTRLAIAVAAVWILPGAARAQPTLRVAHCPAGEAAEYVATLHDRMRLDRLFLDPPSGTADADAIVRDSVKQKVRYVWGWYRTHHVGLQVVLSAEAPEIEVRAEEPSTYGRALVLDWKESAPDLKIEDAYTVAAVKRGRTEAGDPALIVDYVVRFRVAICGAARPDSSTVDVPLPDDPWLAYWYVAAADRRPMRYHAALATTNPCTDDDFAELPHPYYYWYDWWSERAGRDEDGKPYDCRALLHDGVDFSSHRIALERVARPVPDLAALSRSWRAAAAPLGVTILIGAIDHGYKTLPVDDIAVLLGHGHGDPTKGFTAIADAASQRGREWGTQRFLRMLANLSTVMSPTAWISSVEDGYLGVTIDGSLHRSNRPVRVRAYLGLTDVFGPVPPRHWAILRRAFAEDHVVVYAGHSGIGENVSLRRIAAGVGVAEDVVAAELRHAPDQLLAFLSCYSYMYFGLDLVAATRGGPATRKELVLTGSEYSKGDRGALSMIDLADQVLAGTASPTLRDLDDEDFVLIKGIAAGTPAP